MIRYFMLLCALFLWSCASKATTYSDAPPYNDFMYQQEAEKELYDEDLGGYARLEAKSKMMKAVVMTMTCMVWWL